MKRLIVDIDKTICFKTENGSYKDAKPDYEMRDRLNEYKKIGFEIIFFTSRNMRTYKGEIGLINVHTLPEIIKFLDINSFQYDQIIVGKPWCGNDGFYIDDRAIRPNEFKKLTYEEIKTLFQQ